MTKTINLILALVIIVTLLVAGFFVINMLRSGNGPRTTINSEILQSRIEQIAELATLNYIYQNVGVFERYSAGRLFGLEWRWPGTTRSFIIRFDGEVRFGIDIDRIFVDVDNIENIITITMPPARVLTHVVHEHTVEVLDESTGLFTSSSVADYPEFMAYEKARREAWLIENGLLEQAERNARSSIQGLIEAITEQLDEDYEIIFR